MSEVEEEVLAQTICPDGCLAPEGVEVTEVPRPRHAWSDVFVCPNEPCERAFMIKRRTDG